MMRIYLESTIPSYVVARPSRDILQAARQQITKDWWDFRRPNYTLFISQTVLNEISEGEAMMAQKRLELVAALPLLHATNETEQLAQIILESGLIPPTAIADATHIALATTHAVDILLTWNCRHIANGDIQLRLRRLVTSQGFELPALCTPEELPNNQL
jgi:hypothetical protein